MKIKVLFIGLIIFYSCHLFSMGQKFPSWALEAYDLSSLEIDSITLESDEYRSGPCAVIKDPNGYIHYVVLGIRMGKDHGLIVKIESDRIQLRELYEDENGEWEERYVWFP